MGIGTARKQLEADFEAASSTFFPQGGVPPTNFRMFCLGVAMCTHTLKGYTEDPKTWPDGATCIEEAVEAYYEAARKVFHAS